MPIDLYRHRTREPLKGQCHEMNSFFFEGLKKIKSVPTFCICAVFNFFLHLNCQEKYFFKFLLVSMKTLTNSARFYWKPHQNFQWCVSLLFFLVFTTYTGGVWKGIGILNQPLKMLTGEADCRLTCVLRLLYNSFFSLMPQVCLSQMPGSVDTTLYLCGPRLVFNLQLIMYAICFCLHCSYC